VGVGKDIIINGVAVKGNIERSSYCYRGKPCINWPTEDFPGEPPARAYRRLD
jgi:hypothetical protein